ncbi:hypothetical protein [Clostridium butyricum]|uniref:hypothetical protein n=1 Tax=Clostridium butyricum TaxID=1492 RepID=UPI002AB1EB7A|nr:hypothetical protein [Clostridium butyricum]
MIYQMIIYYGAMLNGQAIYSLQTTLEDCNKFPSEMNETMFRYPIEQAILKDGLNIDDFKIGYLTKEQYENRFDIEHEKVTTHTIIK